MHRSVWMAVVVLAAGAAAWAQAPVRRDVSPLSELNPLVEADEMARLGMVELLEALRQQLSAAGDETRARKVQVALLTCQARLAVDEDQRDELLQKAVLVQREVLAEAEKKTDRTSAEELAYLKGRIKLAELLGQEQAEPHVRRIVYLMASEADLKDLNALAKEAAQLCGGAYAAADRLRQSVNLDARDSILMGPQVEQLLDDVRYKSAWMYFREAISLPAGELKTRRLNDAKANVEKFALGDNEQGVKYWSLLLVGMCLRELGEHELAAKYLEQADVVMAQSVDLRLQAKFEKARNAIEWGASLMKGPKANAQAGEAKFAEAVKLVDEFGKAGYAQGKDWELTTDLKRVMLQNYLYERWATVTKDEKKKAEYLAASQKPFAELIVKFTDPGEQTFLLNMLAMKYRGKTDYDNLGSVVLLAMGLREIRSGGDLALGDKLLSMVLGREDEVSKIFRPLALFNLGMLKNSQRLNDDAARHFMRVAREYPDHPYAYQSSLFAVISYNGVFQERRETGQLIDAELRRSFIQAMELLLGNKDWIAKPEAQQWQFQLGWQYDQFAQQVDEGPERNALMTKAVEAYQKVPAGASNHMAAVSFSLRLEVELLGTGGEDGQIKTKARDLISRLAAFSAEAMRQCRKMTDPAQKELADDLRNWAAMAAYAVAKAKYEKLEDHVGAMADLNAIEGNADWGATDVAPAVVEYKIRKLVDEDKTRQAIDEVEKFRQKYPARAADLIRLVVSQIQSSIDRLKDDPARQDDLRKYKEAYLEFANDLYARAEEQKLSPEEMIPMKRLLADALVSNASEANLGKAKTLVDECLAYEQKQRKVSLDEIDGRFNPFVQTVRADRENADALRAKAKTFFEMLEAARISKDQKAYAMNLSAALRNYEELTSPSDSVRQQATEQIHRTLLAALEGLRKDLKDRVPTDAGNLLLQARVLRGMKQYPEAMDLYRRLILGVNPSVNPKFYWEMELETCETLLAAFGDKPGAMRDLKVKIRQLELKDKGGNMGGLKAKFKAIESRAEQLSQ